MADLTGKTIANGYPNLVTIGATTNDNPTTGQLENGKGTAITGIGVNKTPTAGIELDVNGEIRASGGILFGSDTAAANTLDDYEEGTWAPLYEPFIGSFTSITMDIVSATYTKIGRRVTVIANIRTDNVDATGASGNLQIGGLPFTPGSLGFSAISIGRSIAFVNAPDSGVISNNSSKIFLRKNNTDSSSVVSDLTTGAIADRNNLELTATYFTS